jgi:hypothetical protein
MSTLTSRLPGGARRRRRWRVTLVAGAGLTAATMVPTAAPAHAQAAPCDRTITANTTLTSDITCNFRVESGVVFDLGGHTVHGFIIRAGGSGFSRDVRVTNGTVVGNISFVFATGLKLDRLTVRDTTGFAVQPGDNAQVVGNRFLNNGVAIDNFFGGGSNIAFNTFEHNRTAVSIQADDNVHVTANVFRDNGAGVGIRDEDEHGASKAVVERNLFTHNRTGLGLTFQCDTVNFRNCDDAVTGTVIRANTFLANDGSGILVRGSCPNAVPPDAPPGLVLRCAGVGTQITDNLLVGNGFHPPAGLPQGDDGITVDGTADTARLITLTGNRAVHNADLGIDAPGVVDGGGNRAVANGDPRQCVGVAC